MTTRPVVRAEKIRAMRTARGWSVETLAARSGVSAPVIYNLENGRTKRPYIYNLQLLAKAFRVEINDLLDAA